jgi:hypothetical protein
MHHLKKSGTPCGRQPEDPFNLIYFRDTPCRRSERAQTDTSAIAAHVSMHFILGSPYARNASLHRITIAPRSI